MRVTQVRDYSKRGDALPIPNLIEVQTAAYKRFLQADVPPEKRKSEGLGSLETNLIVNEILEAAGVTNLIISPNGKRYFYAGGPALATT